MRCTSKNKMLICNVHPRVTIAVCDHISLAPLKKENLQTWQTNSVELLVEAKASATNVANHVLGLLCETCSWFCLFLELPLDL